MCKFSCYWEAYWTSNWQQNGSFYSGIGGQGTDKETLIAILKIVTRHP